MKVLMILATCLATAYGGGRTATDQEATEALALFNQHCGGGDEMAVTSDGTIINCKISRDQSTSDLTHEVTVPSVETKENRVVFIQPPPVKYVHKVNIKGGDVSHQGKTKIFVLPQHTDHSFTPNVEPGSAGKIEKPQVLFISKKDGANPYHAAASSPVASVREGSGFEILRPSQGLRTSEYGESVEYKPAASNVQPIQAFPRYRYAHRMV